jgi:hypothetical protein
MSEERDAVRRLKQELRLKKMRARLREKHARELARLDRLAERSLGRRKVGRGSEESEER